MVKQIPGGLDRIPFDAHERYVWTNVLRVKIRLMPPAPGRRRWPLPEEQRINPAAGTKPKDEITGQTGNGQASLTLVESIRRCPCKCNGELAKQLATGRASLLTRLMIESVQHVGSICA